LPASARLAVSTSGARPVSVRARPWLEAIGKKLYSRNALRVKF